MSEAVGVLFMLCDGRTVLHRRDGKPRSDPNRLAPWGGELEPDEEPPDAACREIAEETSLKVSREALHFLGTLIVPKGERGMSEQFTGHLFWAQVDSADFEVYEGIGAEVYSIEEALGLPPSEISFFAVEGLKMLLEQRKQHGTQHN